ncbi:hypothetical protein OG21DRAFT_1601876 [Imleria badia]|nr:hypothetical protein OG21DRAFT_1601876 [Imleria badia]
MKKSTALRKARRRRPKLSRALFGYTLFGRPPIGRNMGGDQLVVHARFRRSPARREHHRATDVVRPLCSDTASDGGSKQNKWPVERPSGGRRQERKTRARASSLISLGTNALPHPDIDTFEGLQGSGGRMVPTFFPCHQAIEVVPDHPSPEGLARNSNFDDSSASYWTTPTMLIRAGSCLRGRRNPVEYYLSGSSSDSRSRIPAPFSAGDASYSRTPTHTTHQPSHTEMLLPAPNLEEKTYQALQDTVITTSIVDGFKNPNSNTGLTSKITYHSHSSVIFVSARPRWPPSMRNCKKPRPVYTAVACKDMRDSFNDLDRGSGRAFGMETAPDVR